MESILKLKQIGNFQVNTGSFSSIWSKVRTKKDKNELSVTIPTFVSCESIYHRALGHLIQHRARKFPFIKVVKSKNVRFVLDILWSLFACQKFSLAISHMFCMSKGGPSALITTCKRPETKSCQALVKITKCLRGQKTLFLAIQVPLHMRLEFSKMLFVPQ